jgi:predicted O-linked N-acetylglucosamine transferase (SPINDLY family)
MTFDLEHPSDIYRRINEELEHIIQSLQGQSKEQALNEAQADALEQLNQYQGELSKQLTKLENNAEWNTFTIAFYGETGAGKSSIIETLRILLCEPSKMESQTDFRALRDQYGLSEESLQQFDQNVEQANQKLAKLTQHISSTQQAHEQEHQNALNPAYS